MITELTPNVISTEIENLCQKIAPSQTPVFLDIQVDTGTVVLDCFGDVQRKIEKDGGTSQYGWQIWEIPRIMVEGEFHVVWVSPEGNLVNITPNSSNMPRILFLPDNNRKYMGMPIDNIRHPLAEDPLIEDFIKCAKRMFLEDSLGKLPYTLSEIPSSDEYLALMEKKIEIMQELARKYGH